jgi:prepilin peptidase CpaA
MDIQKVVYLFILIELLVVSYGDFKTRKIPNTWPILNLLIFIFFLFWSPENYPFVFNMFLYSLVFLFVGFVFFLVRIMGAGDSKFLFSFFLLVPLKVHPLVLNNLLLCTVYIGLSFFFYNTFKNFRGIYNSIIIGHFSGLKRYFGTKFPFAPVILVSWIFTGYDLKIWL